MPARADLSARHSVQLAFASGAERSNRELIGRLAVQRPELPLCVVSEFEPHAGEWIPYHVLRSFADNLAAVRDALGDREIERAAVILSGSAPLKNMRRIARTLCGSVLTAYGEDLEETSRAGHAIRSAATALASPRARKWMRSLLHPVEAEIPIRARLAQAAGLRARAVSGEALAGGFRANLRDGVSAVIPSRDGCELLRVLLPDLVPQLRSGEIIVSDNGSTDGTAEWLAGSYPEVTVVGSTQPLSFARAVNAGIARAQFSRILLLNNDMAVEEGFVAALEAAFRRVPDLFCSTAQIFFPAGVRREETGKAVWRQQDPLDFPVRCDDPVPGEDYTWVLYGSGGCSLFDAVKLRELGGVSEEYDPAYVEDLDFGYRAWARGWPSVFRAGARVEHRHRATTARFYSPGELDGFVETNYLRFLIHAIGSPALFRNLWSGAIRRLQLLAMQGNGAALKTLRRLPKIGPMPPPARGPLSESEILALGSGDIAVFPGIEREARETVVVASPYLPFPLSHGGAVRIFNLMKGAAEERDQVLIAFCDELATPPDELLRICREVILVRRHGSHYRRDTPRPDTVEEFASESFQACLKQTIQRWRPSIVQLEFTQMAQYAAHCAPARTVLVEHDITFDLQQQLLENSPSDWELRRQLPKWKEFETAAWRSVDCVVTMSAKDQAAVSGARQSVCIPNGVDTVRFQPCGTDPEPRRLLFIGSFAHLPNLLALEFFLSEVWPLLEGYTLHVIAGARPEYYLDFHRTRVKIDLARPGIELEAFVSDVRIAYARAEQVIAPLTASAGTNIKVLEAMAMGRVVVSTPAGINGLELSAGADVIVAAQASEMADRIRAISSGPAFRKRIERQARTTALRSDWAETARRQSEMYLSLAPRTQSTIA